MNNEPVAREKKSMTDGKSKLLQAARRVRDEIYEAVKVELLDETRTYQTIAESNSISVATVQRIAGSLKISRPVGPRPKSPISEVSNENN
jgi:DNA invertase Pin-like site-specific DNA recombinase